MAEQVKVVGRFWRCPSCSKIYRHPQGVFTHVRHVRCCWCRRKLTDAEHVAVAVQVGWQGRSDQPVHPEVRRG